MKKNGFTLAEVLITLAIIGVVATMTLPALMTNVNEQQARTAIKKGINTLTEAIGMHEAVDGFNYSRLTLGGGVGADNFNTPVGEPGDNSNARNTLVGMLQERTKLDLNRTIEANSGNNAVNTIDIGGVANLIANPRYAYFTDGTALIFPGNGDGAAAGAPGEILVVLDTNGAKGPNLLSNCVGSAAGGDDTVAQGEGGVPDITACDTRANRVIGDQFQLRLTGNVVEPVGPAAQWAFNN